MLSRGLATRNLLLRCVKHNTECLKTQAKRHGSHGTWSYRVAPAPPSRKSILLAEGIGGLAWWWILWHIWTEPEHIYGEWKYVYPSTWTNEELGIPPDDVEIPKVNLS